MGSGYLDAAAGVPLHPAAAEALSAALADGWADPAKLYGAGRRARLLLDGAREAVAEVLGARPDELTFCASGTQAAQLAILGGLAGRRRAGTPVRALRRRALLRPARRRAARRGRRRGDQRAGRPRRPGRRRRVRRRRRRRRPGQPDDRQPRGRHRATGDRGGGRLPGAGVPLHTDAAQSAGRLPVPAGWSLLSASAHKWGGPPGVGVLAVRTGTRWRSPLPADERERGRVPGFENVPAAVAAAAALRAVTRGGGGRERPPVRAGRPDPGRGRRPGAGRRGGRPATDRLPHLVTFSCLYVDGEALLHELDRHGFAVSSGSSCTSSTLTPSHVLEAMGVLSHGNVRVSLHRDTTEADVDRFLAVLPGIVADLRKGLEGL